ncbi:PREDICTED: tRNA-dihydrouridine(20) synthase [NAD(P)+]-like isoform X2 [Priapulus caudatus]|uniref:tRNA-dihydrouridine(20) synthase [NAD(P)+]-like isoform X2 n=1 Tax=Priapulus caudatus TaxID=37621 RepID=A0ABM1FAN8_PRICU|nr:PREDICTED: tRNA-dihydrouridine(20) synthase [NAD(P)+]-like isoform X2 [Priapulus caudatus]
MVLTLYMELIDHKMLQCTRTVNELLGTIDFVQEDGSVVFRTCEKEANQVVFQMGTSDAARSLKVAKLVENDVAAIDINMGCPKEFSIKGGMGAALLSQPDKVRQILTTLVENVRKPVTCKIRLCPTLEETLHFCHLVESCGVAAVAIHGRRKEERPRHANHNDIIREIAHQISIPVIANGGSMDISSNADVERFRSETGCSSVMLARSAQWNASIFRKDGILPTNDVIRAYLKYAVDYDNTYENSKYCIQQILHEQLQTSLGFSFKATKSMADICQLWDMEGYLRDVTAARKQMETSLKRLHAASEADDGGRKHLKAAADDDNDNHVQMRVKFVRSDFREDKLPKTLLLEWRRRVRQPPAPFHTEERPSDRQFRSTVELDGKKYSSSLWAKSKKYAEHAAAIVCLRHLGVLSETVSSEQDTVESNGCVISTESCHAIEDV